MPENLQTYLLIWLTTEAVLIFITWVFFAAVMRFKMLHDAGRLQFKRHPLRWVLAHVALAIGLILDTLVNWRFCTVAGLELPHEFLTTSRLNRWYNNKGTGLLDRWRRWLATYFGDELLDEIDPDGKHIKES